MNLLAARPGRNRRLLAALVVMAMLRAVPAWPQGGPAPLPGTITGQVVDPAGAPVADAAIVLTTGSKASRRQATSDAAGRFAFADVAAGAFQLTIAAPGFAALTRAGQLAPGATVSLDTIVLTLSAGTIGIDVRPTRVIAQQQLKAQEQQRVFGIFQNFSVSYDPNAVPLDARQKFQLTWKTVIDPVRFGWIAGFAAVQQARGDFGGFGGGGEGYAKRYAALTATTLTGTVLTKALLPVIFRQDPRYFYKGTGTTSARVGYAVSRAFLRKGDDGRVRPDYSRILGQLAAGTISNLYYPAQDRHGVRLTLTNSALAIGGGAIDNLLQEFVLRRFTTHARDRR